MRMEEEDNNTASEVITIRGRSFLWQNTTQHQRKSSRTPKGSISMTATAYQWEHAGETTFPSLWVWDEVAHPQDDALQDSHGSLSRKLGLKGALSSCTPRGNLAAMIQFASSPRLLFFFLFERAGK